jgi:hypothetical protein
VNPEVTNKEKEAINESFKDQQRFDRESAEKQWINQEKRENGHPKL